MIFGLMSMLVFMVSRLLVMMFGSFFVFTESGLLFVLGGVNFIPGIVGAIACPIMFAWWFYKNQARAYNTHILASIGVAIFQLPLIGGFPESGNRVNLAVLFVMFVVVSGYVLYVREKLFPDIAFLGTMKKIGGGYIFKD